MIRKATIADMDEVRPLVLMASTLVFEDALKTKDNTKINELFNKFYVTKKTKFSFENTIVYEKDNQIIACLVSYFTKDEPLLNKTVEQLVPTYPSVIEGEPDCLYLDSLAVADEYRGLGISRELFSYIIEQSKTNLSLLVETYKIDTKAYYERLGFKTIKRVNLFDGELYSMIYFK